MRKKHANLRKLHRSRLACSSIEIWNPVKDYSGLYNVSNLGNIISFKRKETTMLKPYTNRKGYKCIGLTKNGIRKHFTIHRLVADSFFEKPRIPRLQINHINGIKHDNRVENLEWVTPEENVKHKVRMGLTARGERSGACCFTSDLVEKIRRSNLTHLEISKIYGVSRPHVTNIKNNKVRKYG